MDDMGWCDESGRHEGWIGHVFADGARSSGASSAEGLYVEGGRWMPGGGWDGEIRPYAEAVAWVVRCECGWEGPRLPLSGERPEDVDKYGDPSERREQEILAPWRAHIAPDNALADLERLADEARALDGRISEAVRLARVAGASWQQIGREVGMTKQGAQQRWGLRPSARPRRGW